MSIVTKRRSIRQYTQEAVNETEIMEILKAAMSAPSAHNQQPWHFVVIDDRGIMDEIMIVHPHSKMLVGAPLSILVCGDTTNMKAPEYLAQDCSAAVMNMLIRITELGLGGVWLGVHPNAPREEGMRKVVKIPSHIVPFALISLGHPAEEILPSDRFDSSKIHQNKW